MKAKPWTARDVKRLRSLYPVKSQRECAALMGRTHKAVASRAKLLGIRRIRKYHVWTTAEDAILRREYPDTPSAKLAESFGVAIYQLYARAHRLGIAKSEEYLRECLAECGRQISAHPRSIAARIPKGNVPPNKGLRRPGWFRGRMRETQFKKGHHNEHGGIHAERPIGALRLNADGYLERKIRNDLRGSQRWRAEHVLIWEREHGPVTPGHIVVFKDRDKTHVTLENLECITLAENMKRKSIHARRPPELKEAIYALIALKATLTKKEKKNGKKQTERPAGSSLRDARATDR